MMSVRQLLAWQEELPPGGTQLLEHTVRGSVLGSAVAPRRQQGPENLAPWARGSQQCSTSPLLPAPPAGWGHLPE